MARTSKRDWLVEGCAVLTENGAAALTIDDLTQRLGVTKGSFYHHFGGIQGYTDALLEFYESEGTLDIIAATENETGAREKLRLLLDITTREPLAIETAFRAWALQNPQVRAVQARIDARREAYLTQLCSALTPHGATMARLLYLVYVGSLQVTPPLPAAEVQRLYREVTRFYLAD